MQIGCGVYQLTIRNRPYLYFWHYEPRDGRRAQIKEYVGPAKATRSRDEAVRRCEAYYRRVAAELDRTRTETLAALATRA